MTFSESVCSQCPNQKYKFHRVGGDGPLDSKLILVSDFPWHSEIGTGKPFTGDSGQVMWNTLSELNIKRENVYVTNTCKCPLRQTPQAVLNACKPHLVSELESLKNKELIVAMGTNAYKILIPQEKQEGLMKSCGKTVFNDEFQTSVLISMNPAAAIINDGRNFHLFKATMSRITNPIIKLNVPTPKVSANPEDLEAWRGMYVSMDIETNSTLDYIDPNSKIDEIGFCNGKEVLIYPRSAFENPDFWKAVRELQLITHNGSFDTAFIEQKYNIKLTITDDTMLLGYMMNESFGADEEGGYALEKLACLFLGVLPWKSIAKERGYYDLEYLAKDVFYTWKLWELWKPKVRPVYNTHFIPLLNWKGSFERQGIVVDKEELHKKHNIIEEELNSGRERLKNAAAVLKWKDPWCGLRIKAVITSYQKLVKNWRKLAEKIPGYRNSIFKSVSAFAKYSRLTRTKKIKGKTTGGYNPDSDSQNKLLFSEIFKQSNIPSYRLKNTQKETLKGIIADFSLEENPFFKEYLQFANQTHTLSIFLTDKWIRADGRAHPSIKIHGTGTGRLSSSQPNIFNIPSSLRGIYLPDSPNHMWLSNDYKQLEMYVAVALAEIQDFIEALNEGQDFHMVTALKLSGLSPDKITKEIRRRAKEFNFGALYGAGGKILAEKLNTTISEAMKFKEKIFGKFDEWKRKEEEIGIEKGYVDTLYGSRRKFYVINRLNVAKIKREIINTKVQGTAAQMAQQRLLEIHKYLEKNWKGLPGAPRIINSVYDSIDLSVPKELIDEISVYVKEVMTQPVDWTTLQFKIDQEISERWK